MIKKPMIWVCLLACLCACTPTQPTTETAPQPTTDIDTPPLETPLLRLDQALHTARTPAQLTALQASYGTTLNIILYQIMRLPTDGAAGALQVFFDNKYIGELYADVQKKFENTDKIEQDFSDALTRYHALFPQQTVPQVVGVITGFAQANALTDSSIVVGLDMFLGSGYKFYPTVQRINTYQRHRLTPDYIVPNSVQLLAEDVVGKGNFTNNLLENMVHQGKILYVCKALQPRTPDSIILGYTSRQTQWTVNSEGSVWAYMVENELIYSTQQLVIAKFMNDAPFTAGLPKASPGRLGRFVGWQMVKSYMERNPTTTLPQLLGLSAEKILSASGYKPQAGL